MSGWTVAPPPPYRFKLSGSRKPLATLSAGDVFSLNEKSKKFAFIKIEGDQILAQPMAPTGMLEPQMAMPLPPHVDTGVLTDGDEKDKTSQDLRREYSVYDRVCLRGSELEGTVIDINRSKFPDVDLIVLWDDPLHGSMMCEIHPHEIKYAGCQAEGHGYKVAKEAREFLKNVQEQHHDNFKNKIKEEIATGASIQQKKREEFAKAISVEARAKAEVVARNTIDTHAADFKRIMEAGILMVTAGQYNYELDEIPGFLNNYAEYIYHKIGNATTDPSIQMTASTEVIKRLARNILDTYFLIRQGYIRKTDGQFCVFSEGGKKMGCYPSKSAANKRLRQIEMFKHMKG